MKTNFSGLKSKYASERELQNLCPQHGRTVFENTDSLQMMHTKNRGYRWPFRAICGQRGDTVIFPPSLTLEGTLHLSLPSVSGAQVRLHSAFQLFHLLLMMS